MGQEGSLLTPTSEVLDSNDAHSRIQQNLMDYSHTCNYAKA